MKQIRCLDYRFIQWWRWIKTQLFEGQTFKQNLEDLWLKSVKNNNIYWLFGSTALFGVGISTCSQNFLPQNNTAFGERKQVEFCFENSKTHVHETNLQRSISESLELLTRKKDEFGCPGIVVSVSINGKTVWDTGIGYSDVENRVPCSARTVMRLASISKPITMAAVAKLWEEGRLDLDKPVHDIVAAFPEKTWKGNPVKITCRQLVSHLGGIRHYEKKKSSNGMKNTSTKEKTCTVESSAKCNNKSNVITNDKNEEDTSSDGAEDNESKKEFDLKEYHLTKEWKSVTESLGLFKNDELMSKPGTEFLYTTHGWTVVSAVVEAASKSKFKDYMKDLFITLDMQNTYFDENATIIYNRSRNYVINKNGRLENAPIVDNSYKWAGGGFISTAGDLIKFGTAMLYCYQYDSLKESGQGAPGYLSTRTMQEMWRVVPLTKCRWTGEVESGAGYGMGWGLVLPGADCGYCRRRREAFGHTGGAIGASSALVVVPHSVPPLENEPTNGEMVEESQRNLDTRSQPQLNIGHTASGGTSAASARKGFPRGVVVAVITNMQGVNLYPIAVEIANVFERNTVEP